MRSDDGTPGIGVAPQRPIAACAALPVTARINDIERATLPRLERHERAALALDRWPRIPQVAGSRPVRYMPGASIRHCQRCGSWRGS